MKAAIVSLLVCLAISLTLVTTPSSIPEANAQDFSRVVAKTRSAVALVFVEESDGTFSSGTGFAISGSTLLATAAHLVTDVKDIIVRYADGSVNPAKPVLIWQEKDVALIMPGKALSGGLLGRSSPPRVGEPVIVIGYPLADKLGISQVSVTQGIVSAVHSDVIQLSVPINPGNSGGPVLDTTGAVLGVVSGTLPGTGLAFASPWSNVKNSLDAVAKDSYPVAISLENSDKSVTGWIEQGTVLVDANLLANLLGGIVFWDPQTKTLTLAVAGKRLRFVQGSRTMDIDGQQVILPLPMTADRRIPLKPVLAILGGSVEVNLASFVAKVSLPGAQSQGNPPPQPETPQATPPKPQPETPQATPPKTLVDPGPRELRAGFGSTTLAFGIDGAQVAKLLGAPDGRQIFQPIPGLTYRPVALVYKSFGIIALLAEGRLWGLAVLNRDWVIQPSGLRIGDSASGIQSAFGYSYEAQNSGEFTIFWYKNAGIGFWVKDGRISSFIVFQTAPSASSPRGFGISGNWSGYWSSGRVSGSGVFVANLSQNGSALSGTAALEGSPCFETLQVSGTVSGESFSFSASTDGITRVLVSGNIYGDTMTGGYTALATGTLCDGDRGTFSANRR